jgi:hypothetical protein
VDAATSGYLCMLQTIIAACTATCCMCTSAAAGCVCRTHRQDKQKQMQTNASTQVCAHTNMGSRCNIAWQSELVMLWATSLVVQPIHETGKGCSQHGWKLQSILLPAEVSVGSDSCCVLYSTGRQHAFPQRLSDLLSWVVRN